MLYTRRATKWIGSAAGGLLAASLGMGCGTANNPAAVPIVPPSMGNNVLTQAEVQSIATAAAASVNVPVVIAISDRRGQVLAVYAKAGAPVTAVSNFGATVAADEEAAALARTAAFFSNDQAPLSTRTVRFISEIHFPPGVSNAESGPLYGIENTNRGCGFNATYLAGQSLPVPGLLHAAGPGLGIQTGKVSTGDAESAAVNPGGVPIFKNNRVAGGIGIVATGANASAIAEYAAVVGTLGDGFAPTLPSPGEVVVGGVALPFVAQTTLPAGVSAGTANGAFTLGPVASGGAAPEGDLIAEHGSTFAGGLTLAQVQQIVQQTVATGNVTRAAIRLPPGSRARFVIAVADLDGSLLALYRMPDATVFSIDVAVAKSRNVVYFSGTPAAADLPGIPAGTAVTNRTIGYAAQPLYPGGIDGTAPGPFFSLFLQDLAHPCTQGSQAASANRNGVVFFPGSVPLYVDGKLAGGLGVSGDGVDQDDYAAAGGAVGFMAPAAIRADQILVQGVRLPYQSFPENPTD
ncbi:MAG: heme-binding protein [Acidobacteriota bacterium]